jgi:exodeoxyribonuclease VII small subunit
LRRKALLYTLEIMESRELNFEKALKRLEEIARLVKKKETSLEESLDLLEESVELFNYCNESLELPKREVVEDESEE